LIPTLVATIANPVSGNVIANDDFGADGKGNVGGGGLLSIKIDGVTYSFAARHRHDANATVIAGARWWKPTLLGGLPRVPFRQRQLHLTPPDVDGHQVRNFAYTIVDGDGDPPPGHGTLHVDVTNSGLSVADPSVIFGTDALAPPTKASPAARATTYERRRRRCTVSGGDGNDPSRRRRQ